MPKMFDMRLPPRPRPAAIQAAARLAAACTLLAACGALADAETVYKCRKAGGGILYSNSPCDAQNAKSLKVLRTDQAQVTIREVKPESVRPYPDPDRPLTAAENATYAVGSRQDESDPDGVRIRPQPIRTPALDHMAKSASEAQSWWGQMRDTVVGWFGH